MTNRGSVFSFKQFKIVGKPFLNLSSFVVSISAKPSTLSSNVPRKRLCSSGFNFRPPLAFYIICFDKSVIKIV